MFPRSRPPGKIDTVRNRRAEQELQRIAVQRLLPGLYWARFSACRVDRALGLARASSVVVPPLNSFCVSA